MAARPASRAPAVVSTPGRGRLHLRRLFGSLVLLGLGAAVPALLLSPGVSRPLRRTVGVVLGDWFPASDAGLRFPVRDPSRIEPGDPVFHAEPGRGLEPAGHVLAVEDRALRILLHGGARDGGPWRLRVLPSPEGLLETLDFAVPSAEARRLGRVLGERLRRVLESAILPGVERRLPALLARLDPREETATREVLDDLGEELVERLAPFGDDLASYVVDRLEHEFDLLDRVGIVWRMVRGDGRGIRRKVAPVVEESAARWWKDHRREVLTAIGEAVVERAPDLERWLLGEVLQAVEEEVARPLLDAEGDTLAREAEAALGEMLAAVAVAPEGGFRPRFAALLRARLLSKDAPLLLLEETP